MKKSNYFIPTLKEKPNDIEQDSQVKMFRAGLLKKVANGLFVYLPLMQRVMEKVNAVIHKNMEAANSVNVKFPILVSKDSLVDSGRWDAFGKEMFKLKDRHGCDYGISPTNEEAACFVAQSYIRSYKDLPFSLYQIQQKHRDEISPRNGVMRAREFTMKDAYSFHTTEECLNEYYQRMNKAYFSIFNSLGINVVAVNADTGAMGGSGSQEIMAISDDGDTDICNCIKCGYAANCETVPCTQLTINNSQCTIADKNRQSSIEKVHTPNVKSIEQLVGFFNLQTKDFLKAVIFKADKKLVVCLVRGDREVNDIKLKKILGAQNLEIASGADIAKSKKTVVGFVGPVGLKGLKIIADTEVKTMSDFIVGANEQDYHLLNVNLSDFKCEFEDIRWVAQGDKCPVCNEVLEFNKATELGHIFKLGKRYTDKLGLKFVNQEGKNETMTMGCYGIGVERTIAAIVQQHSDEKGIIWPLIAAPFKVNLITVDIKNEQQMQVSQDIYNELIKKGVEVIWDDTDARAGFKFADCELIGFPYRIVVGRGIADGKVEVVERKTGEKQEIEIDNLQLTIDKLL